MRMYCVHLCFGHYSGFIDAVSRHLTSVYNPDLGLDKVNVVLTNTGMLLDLLNSQATSCTYRQSQRRPPTNS